MTLSWNLRKAYAVGFACAMALLSPQFAQAQAADSKKPVKIRFVYTLTTTTFPLYYAIRQGLFAKRGIEVEPIRLADFQAVYTAYRAGAADMGSGGLASVVNLRGNGVPIKVIWGASRMANDILVRPDSNIKDLSQLRGQNVGVFGGATGTTANMFVGVLIDQFGFDPRKETRLRYGAPTLQANMLAKGELAAFVSNDPVTAIELANKRVVSIGELAEIYAKQTGGYIPHAGAIAATDSFAKEHPDAMNKFMGAFLEAVGVLQKKPLNVWQDLLRQQMKIDSAPIVETLIERTVPLWSTEWTQRNVDGEIEALKYMSRHAGKGFLDKLPDDAFLLGISPQ